MISESLLISELLFYDTLYYWGPLYVLDAFDIIYYYKKGLEQYLIKGLYLAVGLKEDTNWEIFKRKNTDGN